MFKFLSHHKKPLIFGTTLILVAIMAVISGLNILVYRGNENKSGRVELVIGNKASASTTADYTCDGVDDNVQIQAALNALPATGGKISLLGGTYSLSANITRAINNVTIEGVGQGTVINRNGVNPVITAGGNNWVLANFDTDAGDVSFGATTGYTRWNVNGTALNVQGNLTVSTLTNGRIPIAGVGGLLGDDADLSFSGDTLTVTKLDSPTGRSATLVVAASNASTTVKNQADYVCDGTADDVEIQAAIDALPGNIGLVKCIGATWATSASITLDNNNQGIEFEAGSTINYTGADAAFIIKADYLTLKFDTLITTNNAANYGIKDQGARFSLIEGKNIGGDIATSNFVIAGVWFDATNSVIAGAGGTRYNILFINRGQYAVKLDSNAGKTYEGSVFDIGITMRSSVAALLVVINVSNFKVR